jgi:hypothetical protein
MLPACLYVEPTWEPPVNNPPEILKPQETSQHITLVGDPETFTVIAFDADGDTLQFYWDVPHAVPHVVNTFEDGELTVSVLTFDRDPILDGATIECLVTDLTDIRFITWELEVES